jgi:hypothetical protein
LFRDAGVSADTKQMLMARKIKTAHLMPVHGRGGRSHGQ